MDEYIVRDPANKQTNKQTDTEETSLAEPLYRCWLGDCILHS